MKVKLFILSNFLYLTYAIRAYTEKDIKKLKHEVEEMFYHAYDSYLKYAYPYDELRPLSCDGIDTYGKYSLTLIDALDTLAIMGNYSEFQRIVDLLSAKTDFDANINVSVFETNIRIIGGLLSAHLLSHKAGVKLEPGWPCNGPLLRLAEDVAKRLIVAFDTKTKMPYGTVNLHSGVPKGETTVTCTAGVGTFIIEFGTLSRLTGDPIYEEIAMNALYALLNQKSPLGLFGNHIDIETGKWTAQDAGIGSGVDSYFEYLVKGAILFQKPELMEMFHLARKSIEKYMKKDDWYMWVSMTKGQVTLPVFQSLEAYWPGVLSLIGETSSAMRTLHNYHQVWQQYGFTPEFYYIPHSEAGTNRDSYPLRPELIESIMYLYRATGDPFLLQAGEDILRSIQHSAKTPCGYATIKDVKNHKKEDRMESFFLAETTKYLYLLFDTENFIHNQGQYGSVIETLNGECVIDAGGYIFNTEAHPVDPGALHCCHSGANSNSFNFNEMDKNKAFYRGEAPNKIVRPKTRKKSAKNTDVDESTVHINETDNHIIQAESSVEYVKMSDENISQKINMTEIEYGENSKVSLKSFENITLTNMLDKILEQEKKFDNQEMLERIRKEQDKYFRNTSWENNFSLLHCKKQPFLQRLSLLGEVFDYD